MSLTIKQSYNKEYSKKYREDNKEYIKEYYKKYCEEHKEQMKEKEKKYRKEHKEEMKEKDRKKYETHKEYYKEYTKKYYVTHKEYYKKFKEQRRDYGKKHIKPSLTKIGYIINCPKCSKSGNIKEFNRKNKNTGNIGKTSYIITHPHTMCRINKHMENRFIQENNIKNRGE